MRTRLSPCSCYRLWTRLGPCALILIPFAAAARQGDSPVLLRSRFVVGDVTRYQTTTSVVISLPLSRTDKPLQQALTMNSLQTMEVVKALPGGGAEVITKTTDQDATMDGKPLAVGLPAPITMDFDASGKVVGMKGLPDANPMMGPMGSLFSGGASSFVHLPNHPVRPGETWSQSLVLPGITGNGVVKSTFVRKEKVGRYRTARIHSVITMPVRLAMDASNKPTQDPKRVVMSATGTGTFTSDMNQAIVEGKMIRQGMSGTMVIQLRPKSSGIKNTAQSGMPSLLKMTMKLNMGINMVQ